MIQIEELESFCSRLGTSLEKVKARLVEMGLGNYVAKDHEFHTGKPYIYFAIASLVMSNMKNILELGTGLGESTNVLSKIFPNASIYTIDLPKSDSKHKKWKYFKKRGIERFNTNINEPNIKFIESNSFFLYSMELPRFFELIFVDGGHCYPVVAWDIMFAYGHLAKGGFMFMHDYTSGKTNNVKDVVNYLDDLIDEDIYLLPIDPMRPTKRDGKMAFMRRKT